ncbi:hypothetical protein DFJ74DRAFT_502457 [Hyaloraphidium curvatum]|nr:hypothetical protein DFJ74DRAFT_502457 [Hyaloraphidium curvatum]
MKKEMCALSNLNTDHSALQDVFHCKMLFSFVSHSRSFGVHLLPDLATGLALIVVRPDVLGGPEHVGVLHVAESRGSPLEHFRRRPDAAGLSGRARLGEVLLRRQDLRLAELDGRHSSWSVYSSGMPFFVIRPSVGVGSLLAGRDAFGPNVGIGRIADERARFRSQRVVFLLRAHGVQRVRPRRSVRLVRRRRGRGRKGFASAAARTRQPVSSEGEDAQHCVSFDR